MSTNEDGISDDQFKTASKRAPEIPETVDNDLPESVFNLLRDRYRNSSLPSEGITYIVSIPAGFECDDTEQIPYFKHDEGLDLPGTVVLTGPNFNRVFHFTECKSHADRIAILQKYDVLNRPTVILKFSSQKMIWKRGDGSDEIEIPIRSLGPINQQKIDQQLSGFSDSSLEAPSPNLKLWVASGNTKKLIQRAELEIENHLTMFFKGKWYKDYKFRNQTRNKYGRGDISIYERNSNAPIAQIELKIIRPGDNVNDKITECIQQTERYGSDLGFSIMFACHYNAKDDEIKAQIERAQKKCDEKNLNVCVRWYPINIKTAQEARRHSSAYQP